MSTGRGSRGAPGGRRGKPSGRGAPAPRSGGANRSGRPVRSSGAQAKRSEGGVAATSGPKRAAARQGPAGQRRRDPNDLGGDRVEGRQAVVELLRAGRRRVSEVVVAEEADESFIVSEILDLAREDHVSVVRMPRKKLDSLALTEAHQGVLATAAPLRAVELEEMLEGHGSAPFLLVLDGVTDPGNLGAILRTADVAGVTGVVLPRHRAVRITPAAAKSAAGAIEYLPIALVGGLPNAITQMAQAGIWSFGLDASARESIFATTADLAGPTALVLGAEGTGLSRLVGERCDQLVSIPQTGHLDSLNVANAAAIACFEVVRRRS